MPKKSLNRLSIFDGVDALEPRILLDGADDDAGDDGAPVLPLPPADPVPPPAPAGDDDDGDDDAGDDAADDGGDDDDGGSNNTSNNTSTNTSSDGGSNQSSNTSSNSSSNSSSDSGGGNNTSNNTSTNTSTDTSSTSSEPPEPVSVDPPQPDPPPSPPQQQSGGDDDAEPVAAPNPSTAASDISSAPTEPDSGGAFQLASSTTSATGQPQPAPAATTPNAAQQPATQSAPTAVDSTVEVDAREQQAAEPEVAAVDRSSETEVAPVQAAESEVVSGPTGPSAPANSDGVLVTPAEEVTPEQPGRQSELITAPAISSRPGSSESLATGSTQAANPEPLVVDEQPDSSPATPSGDFVSDGAPSVGDSAFSESAEELDSPPAEPLVAADAESSTPEQSAVAAQPSPTPTGISSSESSVPDAIASRTSQLDIEDAALSSPDAILSAPAATGPLASAAAPVISNDSFPNSDAPSDAQSIGSEQYVDAVPDVIGDNATATPVAVTPVVEPVVEEGEATPDVAQNAFVDSESEDSESVPDATFNPNPESELGYQSAESFASEPEGQIAPSDLPEGTPTSVDPNTEEVAISTEAPAVIQSTDLSSDLPPEIANEEVPFQVAGNPAVLDGNVTGSESEEQAKNSTLNSGSVPQAASQASPELPGKSMHRAKRLGIRPSLDTRPAGSGDHQPPSGSTVEQANYSDYNRHDDRDQYAATTESTKGHRVANSSQRLTKVEEVVDSELLQEFVATATPFFLVGRHRQRRNRITRSTRRDRS